MSKKTVTYKYLPTRIRYAKGTKPLSQAQLQQLDDSIGGAVKGLEQMPNKTMEAII